MADAINLGITKDKFYELEGQTYQALKNIGGDNLTFETLQGYLGQNDLFSKVATPDDAGTRTDFSGVNQSIMDWYNPTSLGQYAGGTLPSTPETGTGALAPTPLQLSGETQTTQNAPTAPTAPTPYPTDLTPGTTPPPVYNSATGQYEGYNNQTPQASTASQPTLEQLQIEKKGQIYDPVSGQIWGSSTAPYEVLLRGQLLKPGEMGTNNGSLETPSFSGSGQSIEEYTQGLDSGATGGTTGGTTSGSSSGVGTSTEARAKEMGLNLPTPPTAPDLFTTENQAELATLKSERAVIQEEIANLMNEKMIIQEEMQTYSDQQVGLPEAGRVGAVAEKGKELQRRLDVLNRRELVLETKLSNRNTVISELMGLQKTEYDNAVQIYKLEYDKAIKTYELLDEKASEIKKDSMASWQVLAKQYEALGLTWDTLGPVRQQQIEALAIQAGMPGMSQYIGALPAGSTRISTNLVKDTAGNNIYQTLMQKADGSFEVINTPTGIQSSTSSDGKSDTEKRDEAFEKDLKDLATKVIAGDMSREQAKGILRGLYPDYDENSIYDLVPDE